MTAVAGSPGEFSLGALNETSKWLPLLGLTDDLGFTITGTFVGTVSVQISNQGDETKTRYRTLPDVYTSAAGPLAVPRIAGRWVRFIMTAYTSGTAYVGISAPNRAGSDPTPFSVSPQVEQSGTIGDAF